MFGMGSPQTRRKSRMSGGKLSKTDTVKIQEKIKLFKIFQGGVKTIGDSVSFVESISNDCVAGNSRREQMDSRGPMGVEQVTRVESRSIPCGLRQAARNF